MKHRFTPNDLIRFIYKETSVAETMGISEALSEDRQLFEEYESLKGSYRKLPKAKFSPSNRTIQNILRYSENSAVETHP